MDKVAEGASHQFFREKPFNGVVFHLELSRLTWCDALLSLTIIHVRL